MLRKNIRQRKEYLFNKNKELKEREHQEKLLKIKKAIEKDKKMPNELRKERGKLEKDLELADDKTIVARTHIDDEYEEAKYRDPKVLVTTSRGASQRLV
jgi:U3 small nucleolar ribonucleoprotein protein IMP4